MATRLAAPGSGGSFHWELDGNNFSGSIAVPDTGNYQNYQYVHTSITLTAGTHVLRLKEDAIGDWGSVANFESYVISGGTPTAPTNLVATPSFPTRVDLSWTDTTNNETGFEIERSDDGGSTWSEVGSVRANVTFWSDNSVTGGNSYEYRVRAVNSGSQSGYTDDVPTTAPTTVAYPIKINFQVDGTPAIIGYKIDKGSEYGDRGDGLSYGWN